MPSVIKLKRMTNGDLYKTIRLISGCTNLQVYKTMRTFFKVFPIFLKNKGKMYFPSVGTFYLRKSHIYLPSSGEDKNYDKVIFRPCELFKERVRDGKIYKSKKETMEEK